MLTEARRARLAAAMARFDMGIPLNDLNRAFDLGFRPFPWGEQGYIPTMMQAVGTKAESGNQKAEIAKAEDPFSRLAAVLTRNRNHR